MTSAPDPHLAPADIAAAVSSLLLHGLFSPDRLPEGTPDQRIAAFCDRARAERARLKGSYLVLWRNGKIQVELPDHVQETETLSVCFDACDTQGHRAPFADALTRSLATVGIALPRLVRLERICDCVVVFADSGKQLVSLSAKVSANLVVSTTLDAAELNGVAEVANVIDRRFQRVCSRYVEALQCGDDHLRAFLAAWTALEVLTNKLFEFHAKAFHTSLRAGRPAAFAPMAEHVEDVMKSRYRLTDKFCLIASDLAPDTSSADLNTFRRSKKLRDAFSHGKDIDMEQLPTQEVLGLVRKYLLNSTAGKGSPDQQRDSPSPGLKGEPK